MKIMKALVYDQYADDDDFSKILKIKEIPAGKENHILYTMPGTIDYRGMTFMRIDSSKFFNRFQKFS